MSNSSPVWDAMTAIPVRHGDQPSEIIPRLFLSGHPARFSVGRGFPQHPAKHLADTLDIRVVVNCCAAQSWALYAVEDVSNGVKTPTNDREQFLGELKAYLEKRRSVPSASHAGSLVFHVNIQAEDTETFHLHPFFGPAAEILQLVGSETTLQTGGKAVHPGPGVLVHCQMGVSRSCSIIAAHLVKEYHQPLDAVLAHMTSRRSCVNPNPAFMEQLKAWEAECTTTSTPSSA